MIPTHADGMADEELLASLDSAEAAVMRRALEREDEARARTGAPPYKPTWEELWEAGWVENPRCYWPLPTEAGLLQELREIGPGSWTCYGDCGCPRGCEAILQAVYAREGGRGRGNLRRRITKVDGVMWGWKA